MTEIVLTPAPPRPPTGFSALLRAFNANKASWIGLAIVVLVVLAAVFAPLLAPHDPLEQDILDRLKPPLSQVPPR